MLERIDNHIFLIKKSSFIFLLFYVETFLGKIYFESKNFILQNETKIIIVI